ncbi:MAG: hypothetical protein CVT68_09290 [Actinobacteria bacterium HGW-Actinobacteria-8]|nr:MAG: hypothetical protein CVT68_09290 [Actinobacteria bacterium HGW-Actinobacteria-8]
MSSAGRRIFTPGRLFGLAVAASILTWVMLLIGGTVNPTGSSLACSDWRFNALGMPLCNGELFPAMTGGVQFEHGHRLWGWLVGVSTVGVAVWSLIDKRLPKATRWLAVGGVFMVLAQGALGGITVLLGLNPWVSTSHLLLGYGFLSLMIFVAWRLHPTRRAAPAMGARLPRGALALAVGLVLVQALFGAAMRHFGAGMICGDDPVGCGGLGFWPAMGLGKLHMTHRLFGYAVLVLVVVIAVRARRQALTAGRTRAAWLALAPAVLVVTQVALGLLTVVTGKGVAIVTLHTAVGGLLMATTVMLYLAFGPLGDPRPERSAAATAAPTPSANAWEAA